MVDSPTKHYNKLAEQYDDIWEYSPQFVSWMTDEIQSRLAVTHNNSIVDLGGGTGIYSHSLAERLMPKTPILCVDPSEGMISQLSRTTWVTPELAEANQFLKSDYSFDRVFMKEVIHHITDKTQFFNLLYKKLPVSGVFILILLPPTIEYPLFKSALKLYEKLQPDYHDLEQNLANTGFTTVSTQSSFLLKIRKQRYFEMIHTRYMSLLSEFTDDELAHGLEELAEQYENESDLIFNDTFAFLVAVKP